jgi:hypothetical protein
MVYDFKSDTMLTTESNTTKARWPTPEDIHAAVEAELEQLAGIELIQEELRKQCAHGEQRPQRILEGLATGWSGYHRGLASR